jgi:hypothetical protein
MIVIDSSIQQWQSQIVQISGTARHTHKTPSCTWTTAMQLLFVCVFLLLSVTTEANAGIPPTGPNCNIEEPPSGSGEFDSSAKAQNKYSKDEVRFTKAYPRLSDMPPDYTGCQSIWTYTGGTSPSVRRVYFLSGQVASIWPPHEGRLEIICKAGEDGRETGCIRLSRFLVVSFPADCYKTAIKTGRVSDECVRAFESDYNTFSGMDRLSSSDIRQRARATDARSLELSCQKTEAYSNGLLVSWGRRLAHPALAKMYSLPELFARARQCASERSTNDLPTDYEFNLQVFKATHAVLEQAVSQCERWEDTRELQGMQPMGCKWEEMQELDGRYFAELATTFPGISISFPVGKNYLEAAYGILRQAKRFDLRKP